MKIPFVVTYSIQKPLHDSTLIFGIGVHKLTVQWLAAVNNKAVVCTRRHEAGAAAQYIVLQCASQCECRMPDWRIHGLAEK